MYARQACSDRPALGPLRRHSCVRTERLVRQSNPPAGGHPGLQYQPGLCHFRIYLHRRDGRVLCPGPTAQNKYLPSHTRLLGSFGACALPESEGHLRGRHGDQRGDRSRCFAGACSGYSSHQDVLHPDAQSLPVTGRRWCGYRGKLHQNVSCDSITRIRRPDGRFCEVQSAWVQYLTLPFNHLWSTYLQCSPAQPKSP